jgi:hypothetical protein
LEWADAAAGVTAAGDITALPADLIRGAATHGADRTVVQVAVVVVVLAAPFLAPMIGLPMRMRRCAMPPPLLLLKASAIQRRRRRLLSAGRMMKRTTPILPRRPLCLTVPDDMVLAVVTVGVDLDLITDLTASAVVLMDLLITVLPHHHTVHHFRETSVA